MNKLAIIILVLAMLIIAAFVGCSDDNCASCPGSETIIPLGTAHGVLTLLHGASMLKLDVSSYGAAAPNLDSVKVGDSLVDQQSWHVAFYWPYADAHSFLDYTESGDSSTFMYEPGDIASISIWGEDRSSVCRLKILSPELAAAQITDPAPDADTIAPGRSETIYWHRVANVDYYAIMIAWYVLPLDDYTFAFYCTTDTSFVVSGAMEPVDTILSFDVIISPFNGPDPLSGKSNWSGNLLDGVVYSPGHADFTTVVIDQPPTVLRRVSATAMKALPEANAAEIIAKVYEKYRK